MAPSNKETTSSTPIIVGTIGIGSHIDSVILLNLYNRRTTAYDYTPIVGTSVYNFDSQPFVFTRPQLIENIRHISTKSASIRNKHTLKRRARNKQARKQRKRNKSI